MLELRQLKELLTLAQTKTVSEAAKQLCLSQPALSRSLQRLEEELKVELFARSKNKVELTDTGELAVTYARQILDLSELMVTTLRRYQEAKHTITLQTCAPAPLWELTTLLSIVCPKLTQMVSINDDEAALTQALFQGEADCVVVTVPPTEPNPELICLPFLTEHLYFAVHRCNQLADRRELSFAQLDGGTFLLRPHIGFWQHVIDQYLPHSEFLHQQDDHAFNTIVSASCLLSFTSDIVLRREGARPERVCIPISDPAAQVTYHALLLRRNERKLAPLIAELAAKAERLKRAQQQAEPEFLT